MPDDTELLAQLRSAWTVHDPVPDGLADRVIAAVAAADLSQEYAVLTLVAQSSAPVRTDASPLTLQFSDGTTSVLLHITVTESGRRRLDGWIDGAAITVELEQDAWTGATAPDSGRFAFDDVPPGWTRLRVTIAPATDADGPGELETPPFEV